jgi:hypothetical protein
MISRARGAALFSEKIPEPRQLNDVIPGQYRANQIGLRRGVHFIQMTLRFRLRHKLLNALVESAVDDHVGRAPSAALTRSLLTDGHFLRIAGALKSIWVSDMLGGFLS